MQGVTVAKLGRRQIARRNPQHGQIGGRIVSDKLRSESITLLGDCRQLMAAVHDMAIGDGETIRSNHESRPLAASPVRSSCLYTNDCWADLLDHPDDGSRISI